MESLSMMTLSCSPPIRNQTKTHKPKPFKPKPKPKPKPNHTLLSLITTTTTTTHFLTSLPSLASTETILLLNNETNNKISIESVLLSIDDFFNRNPFFVATCTFIWLVVVPVAQEYFRKYKFVSAVDAFRKLRDDSRVQLLDIREEGSVGALGSPNLKVLEKSAVRVEFLEDDEDGFVEKVKEVFPNPQDTVLSILDNYDGNSLKAAELLFKNGFKEAYAIRGGVRGNKGWMVVQETLLPPSVHILPKKKKKKKKGKVSEVGTDGNIHLRDKNKNDASSSTAGETRGKVNGHVTDSVKPESSSSIGCRSPYPNYTDLKPPSSPTPSKPR